MKRGRAPVFNVETAVRQIRRSPVRRGDPSGAGGLVRAYSADMKRRWASIARVVETTVNTNDALGLAEWEPGLVAAAVRPASSFEFRIDPEGKGEDFAKWLGDQIDDGVLEIARGPGRSIASNAKWQDVYVRAAYARGVEHANYFLQAAGFEIDPAAVTATFSRAIHTDAVALLYTRQFTDLQGISAAVDTSLSRVLSLGLIQGEGPAATARAMRRQIADIGVRRSILLSRTETIRAHAEATLNRYAEAGVENVAGVAEFLTAQDERVCPDCLALEGGIFNLAEARGLIPVHPACRCVWLPVV